MLVHQPTCHYTTLQCVVEYVNKIDRKAIAGYDNIEQYAF